MHINNEYIKHGEIDPKSLLIQEDITEEVEKAAKGIKERISLMFDIISSKTAPKADISKQCNEPYECPPKDDCWKFLPNINIFHLYRGGQKAFDLFAEGIETIGAIPDNVELSDKQELQRECEKTGKIHIHKEKIKHFLKTLHAPLYFLDFETFSFAIPRYDGNKPYQNIPFQFSLHVVQNNKTEHFSFLADGKGDPREKFAEELKKVMGDKGTVITYNQSFEISRLKELAEAFPKHKKWIDNVISRVVDLLIPFREFAYYNPAQKGSASIKKVLPALTGKSYEDMNIANGGDASLSFIHILTGKVSKEEEKKIRKDLEDYCGLDTEGMIWIVDELRKLVK